MENEVKQAEPVRIPDELNGEVDRIVAKHKTNWEAENSSRLAEIEKAHRAEVEQIKLDYEAKVASQAAELEKRKALSTIAPAEIPAPIAPKPDFISEFARKRDGK